MIQFLKTAQRCYLHIIILALHLKDTTASMSAFQCSSIPSLFIRNTITNDDNSFGNSCSTPSEHYYSRQIIHLPSLTRHYNTKDSHSNHSPNQSSNESDESDEYYVTDEEALLACRAYLQRKNRLGWTQSKRRKALAQNALALSSSSVQVGSRNLNTGYFWEDPSELVYLKKGRPRRIVEGERGRNKNDGDKGIIDGDGEMMEMKIFKDNDYDHHDIQMEQDGDNAGEMGDSIQLRTITEDEYYSNKDGIGGDGDIFTSYPAFPPATHVLQSQAKKELFNNPEWKAKWYKKRWGDDKEMMKRRKRNKKQRKIKKLIQNIPSILLRSPELASLSDEEIEDAVNTYVNANKKRRESHLRRSREMKRTLVENSLSNRKRKDNNDNNDVNDEELHTHTSDTLEKEQVLTFLPSEQKLKEIQDRRSKRAKKAYETRIRNKKAKEIMDDENKYINGDGRKRKGRVLSLKSKKDNKGDKSYVLRQVKVEGKLSPRQAMERIEEMMRENKLPLVDDINTILEPKRLSGRKELLRNVLSHSFDLKGKCIPDLSSKIEVDNDQNNDSSCPDEFYSDATITNMEHIQKKFATQSTVLELGSFIKYLLDDNNTM